MNRAQRSPPDRVCFNVARETNADSCLIDFVGEFNIVSFEINEIRELDGLCIVRLKAIWSGIVPFSSECQTELRSHEFGPNFDRAENLCF